MPYSRFLLDIGHGLDNLGKGTFDSGAVSEGVAEHTLVAGFAEAARYALENQFPVVILEEGSRAEVVAQANASYRDGDYFLSLHINSATNKKASGTEVVYSETAPPERALEASKVAARVAQVLRIANRGPLPDTKTPNGKKQGLTVLRDSIAPALLIEFGFITNKGDVKAMKERGTLALCETIRLLAKR